MFSEERRALSEDGLVAVKMIFDEETGIIIYGPEVVSRGFVFEMETGHLLEDAKCVILEIVEEIGPEIPIASNRIRANVSGGPATVLLLHHPAAPGDPAVYPGDVMGAPVVRRTLPQRRPTGRGARVTMRAGKSSGIPLFLVVLR